MPAPATVILPAARSLSLSRSIAHPRLLIFLASLMLKGLAGAVFFGSVDLVNSATASLALLAGRQIHVPYFPVINAFLWFGGVLSATLSVPFPLSLKMVPILFDSLLAVLIYDLVRRREPRLAMRTGLLYAFSPLALMITSFQGQWDAIALFFLLLAFGILEDKMHDSRKEILFGVFFGVSVLIKPIGLPFLLLFPARKRGAKWFVAWPPIAGLIAVLGIAFAIFARYGYSTIDILIDILAYSNKGVQTFGLPFALPQPHWHMRLWIVLPMALLAVLHHRQKLTALDAMLLFYLCCLATTGLSPQYLLWPLPLLLVTNRLGLAAFYTSVGTLFLLLYYSNPWTSFYASENLGVFAPLRGLSWLLPPAVLESRELLPMVHALGNVAFPCCAMVVTALVFKSGCGRMAEEANRSGDSCCFSSALVWHAAALCLVFATILLTRLTVQTSGHSRLTQIWKTLPAEYGLHIRSLDPTVVLVRDSAGFASLNVVVLLALFTAVWCVFCFPDSVSGKRPERHHIATLPH